jgi:hypothetical protein
MALPDDRIYTAVTIAQTASASSAVTLGGLSLIGLVLPAVFEATTAKIGFQVSADGSTYNDLKDADGTLVQISVAATNTVKAVHLDAPDFAPWPFVKLVAYASDGTTAVAQATAARAFTAVLGKVV